MVDTLCSDRRGFEGSSRDSAAPGRAGGSFCADFRLTGEGAVCTPSLRAIRSATLPSRDA